MQNQHYTPNGVVKNDPNHDRRANLAAGGGGGAESHKHTDPSSPVRRRGGSQGSALNGNNNNYDSPGGGSSPITNHRRKSIDSGQQSSVALNTSNTSGLSESAVHRRRSSVDPSSNQQQISVPETASTSGQTEKKFRKSSVIENQSQANLNRAMSRGVSRISSQHTAPDSSSHGGASSSSTNTNGNPKRVSITSTNALSKKQQSRSNYNRQSSKAVIAKQQSTVHYEVDKRRKKGMKRPNIIIRSLQCIGLLYCEVELIDPAAIEAAKALNLTQKHLRKLQQKFRRIDIDGSGTIDSDEFFESLGENSTPFTTHLFSLIDIDGSGTIEFDEYVRVLATYCMYSKDEILRFCFECFDLDKSGSIDEREFISLCKTVNNAAPAFPNNFRRALDDFDGDRDGLIDYAEFIEIDRRFPLILFPAFRLQDLMQRHTLGEHQWLQIMKAYTKAKTIESYKQAHNGQLPPDPLLTKIAKILFPCMFKEEEFIKLGEDMEMRHRRATHNDDSASAGGSGGNGTNTNGGGGEENTKHKRHSITK